MGKIVVVGSLNMDFVVAVKHMPRGGETISGKSLNLVGGGKGANQAYAAGKCGADIAMIGAIGDDSYGSVLVENLKAAGVDVSGVETIPNTSTGTAFINVSEDAENSIVIVAGANGLVDRALVDRHMDLIDECDIVVMQLEIPMDTVEYVAKEAKKRGKMVILDPAPAPDFLPDSLVAQLDILKPNETELGKLSGYPTDTLEQVFSAARKMMEEKGVKTIIATRGSHGSVAITPDEIIEVAGQKVKAVDTTAAGDSYTAALATKLAQGASMREAMEFAGRFAGVVTTRVGAQSSIPTLEEVEEFYKA